MKPATKYLLPYSCVCIRFRKHSMPMVLTVRTTENVNYALSKLIFWAFSCSLIKDQWFNTSDVVEVLKRFRESLVILPPSDHEKTVCAYSGWWEVSVCEFSVCVLDKGRKSRRKGGGDKKREIGIRGREEMRGWWEPKQERWQAIKRPINLVNECPSSRGYSEKCSLLCVHQSEV